MQYKAMKSAISLLLCSAVASVLASGCAGNGMLASTGAPAALPQAGTHPARWREAPAAARAGFYGIARPHEPRYGPDLRKIRPVFTTSNAVFGTFLS
jgi:hypothetical protein